MSQHIGYFIDSIANQQWFRCLQCRYDSFSQDSIETHVTHQHELTTLPEDEIPIQDWIAQQHDTLPPIKIGLGLLTWNTHEASQHAGLAILAEKLYLAELGVQSCVLWADNGSTDGTVDDLLETFHFIQERDFTLFAENKGQSKARNAIIAAAKANNCDFLLFVDGDVEVIRYSAFAMARALLMLPLDVGCIGMYCRNCTHERDAGVATSCRKIEQWMIDEDPPIAWTNYGMFRREVFETIKFEENGPFSGPGWGFEDDDYSFQMKLHEFGCHNTKYFRHMHRRRHSSLKQIDPGLAAKVYNDRKAYLVQKYQGDKSLETRLMQLFNQTMPVLEY